MKKIFTTLAFVLFTTSAFSYSCPMLWGEVDELLKTAKDSGKQLLKLKRYKLYGIKVKKLMMREVMKCLKSF